MTLIAMHLLQNHAPSNLNRDDNGDPKDTFFGGTRRARTSSQAIKRSLRTAESFQKAFDDSALLGFRTKLLPEKIRALVQANPTISRTECDVIVQQAARLGTDQEMPTATADEKDTQHPAQLIYLTEREIVTLAESLIALRGQTIRRNQQDIPFGEWKGSEVAQKIGRPFEPHAVDIAMFGRMTTASPFKNIEAAVQVAHALSTHKVAQEFDFFTAVDDISGETGAGMLGDVAFNSATYYKYINIHWEALVSNLGNQRDVAVTAVAALLRTAMTAIPCGKQNTFAAHNLPDFALIEVLEQNIPVSYANAFLKPVRAPDELSLMDASIQALAAYAAPLPTRFGLPMERAVFYQQTEPPLGDVCATLDELAAWVTTRLPKEST